MMASGPAPSLPSGFTTAAAGTARRTVNHVDPAKGWPSIVMPDHATS
mgnify:CR=1 FL=1